MKQLIKKYTEEENITELDKLYPQVVTEADNKKLKKALANGYLEVFGILSYDFHCDKLNDISLIKNLMNLIEKVKTLDSSYTNYYSDRGSVYHMLAKLHQGKKKSTYLEASINEFELQLKKYPRRARAITNYAFELHQLNLHNKTTDIVLWHKVKNLILKSIRYSYARNRKLTIHSGYEIFFYFEVAWSARHNFNEINDTIYQEYIDNFESLITPYAAKKPIIYYYWIHTLVNNGYLYDTPIITGFNESFTDLPPIIQDKVVTLLPHIKQLKTNNTAFLTALGNLFQKLGKECKSIAYLDEALHYFLEAFKNNDTSWTNPYYATQTLKLQSDLYVTLGKPEKVKPLLEKGLHIFKTAALKQEDFQLSLYYGEYLYNYAVTVEKENNITTLKAAQKQFEISKVLGEDFYTQPFYGLALIALKLGEKTKCIAILKECATLFSDENHTHNFSQIRDYPDDIYYKLLPCVATVLNEK